MKRYSILVILLMCLTFNVNALCTSNEDMVDQIDSIFTNRVSNIYTLEYTNDVDINYINQYLNDAYLIPNRHINVFTYKDIVEKNELLSSKVEDNKLILDVKTNITNDEYNKVKEFGNKLNSKYSSLTDNEKIYLVINYIKDNITKDESNSIYDGLFNHKINETYLLTQFMLSNLDIESYIYTRTSRNVITRKYNIVKVNNKWYILDIDNNYLLVGYQVSDFRPDSYSNGIYVSAYNYRLNTYDINYNEINDLLVIKEPKIDVVEKITNTVEEPKKEKNKIEIDEKELIEWVVLIISLCVIILVIRHYTR